MHDVLQVRLEVTGVHAGYGDAVAVAEFDHRVAVRVCGNQRRELLKVLNAGEVIEIDGVGFRVEVKNGFGARSGVNTKLSLPAPATRTVPAADEDAVVTGGSTTWVPPLLSW